MKNIFAFILITLMLSVGCTKKQNKIEELQITDTKKGSGTVAAKDMSISVHYTGWLYDEKADDKKGKKFDSSYDRNEAFKFVLGTGQVIAGWDTGVGGMQVGGKRTIIVPPHLGYGEQGAGTVIPGNSTLIFEIELLSAD